MTIKEKIAQLHQLMKEYNIQIYYVPSGDYHQSEYVGEYFRAVEFISGFTGSAGTMVITLDKAGLWTDGRYFIQAENQLKDTGITLYRLNEPDVPSVLEFIEEEIKIGEKLGFDGKVVSTDFVEKIQEKIKSKNISIISEQDLIEKIWDNRPILSENPIFILEEKYTGESTASKIEKIRKILQKENIDAHIINTLDDIAWIYNIRGNDIKNNPVTLAYSVITSKETILYINLNKISPENRKYFDENNIMLKDYEEIYKDLRNYSEKNILLDKIKVNYALYNLIPNKDKVISKRNPSTDMKAIKNSVEIENIRNSHLEDAMAMTKFIYWLKNIDLEKENITEYDIVEKLEIYRKLSPNYIEPSFDTIAAFGKNAAMMHYKPMKDSSSSLKYGEFLLVDSGGQYYNGTTDITRTFFLENENNKISQELKEHYTLVLKGMIRLSKSKFLAGVTGTNLDILAREAIWERAIDYKCGTGHGIGFVLNVHEGPHGIRPAYNSEALKEGMIITNEPGIYVEDSHGIRIENELLVREFKTTEFGKFLEFETLTYVPIDLEAIEKDLLEKEEIKFLNNYHKMVYNKISSYLSENEKKWLLEKTKEI